MGLSVVIRATYPVSSNVDAPSLFESVTSPLGISDERDGLETKGPSPAGATLTQIFGITMRKVFQQLLTGRSQRTRQCSGRRTLDARAPIGSAFLSHNSGRNGISLGLLGS